MKVLRHGYTVLELLIIVAVVCGLTAMLMVPARHNSREDARRASYCRSSLKQIGLALLQYSQDYDARLPYAALFETPSSMPPYQRPHGWADAVYPYLKSWQIFQCPQEAHERYSENATVSGFTDYYLNSNVAGQPLKNIGHPTKTLLSGDGNDGTTSTDSRYNLRSFPDSWYQNGSSPAHRHLEGANYLWVDGHVKWLYPEDVSTNLPLLPSTMTSASFALR